MTYPTPKAPPIGESRDREMLKDADSYTYAERTQGELQAHLFIPRAASEAPRTAVIFFHGGFFDAPMIAQFVPHALHFAHRGAVGIVAETRIGSKHQTTAMEAIEDARELVRWLRRNASELNIDPQKIVVGGAGGGALLALLTTMPKEKHLPPVDGIDCRPQALILFSSLLNSTARSGQAAQRFPDDKLAAKHSPSKLVRRKLPPMILFHGKADRITPVAEAERFTRRLRWRGNKCQLVAYDGAEHMFFNFNVSHLHFELTINAADQFLVENGLLEADADAF